MAKMNVADWVGIVLLVAGGLNWLLVADFDFNLVETIFGTGTLSLIVYNLVGLSAIYSIGRGIYSLFKWLIYLKMNRQNKKIIGWAMIILGLAMLGYVTFSILADFWWQIVLTLALIFGGIFIKD